MKVVTVLSPRDCDAVLFDLDGVLTRTASVHASAWKELLDGFLEPRAARTGEPCVPFDSDSDSPRYDGVAAFLDRHGIELPIGSPDEGPDVQSVRALGNQKDRYFMELLEQLGLDAGKAEIEPAGKVAHVKKLRAEGQHVAMAGDGINDAPALSEAEGGIAMGTVTEVAIQSAGITLVKGDLCGITQAIRLSRATMSHIRQNFIFAFLYNALEIPVAAGALYLFFGWRLRPIIAGAAMSLSSVSVIINALRLRKVRL